MVRLRLIRSGHLEIKTKINGQHLEFLTFDIKGQESNVTPHFRLIWLN